MEIVNIIDEILINKQPIYVWGESVHETNFDNM